MNAANRKAAEGLGMGPYDGFRFRCELAARIAAGHAWHGRNPDSAIANAALAVADAIIEAASKPDTEKTP